MILLHFGFVNVIYRSLSRSYLCLIALILLHAHVKKSRKIKIEIINIIDKSRGSINLRTKEKILKENDAGVDYFTTMVIN